MARGTGSRPTNILLVDDRPGNLLGLETILAPLGQRLVMVRSGVDALQHAVAEDFAVILLDVRMPVMDGYQTAEALRSLERTRTTPILFLTAYRLGFMQVFKGYACGAVDFIMMPCSPEILRSKVKIFVEMAQHAEVLNGLGSELERLTGELKATRQELNKLSATIAHDVMTPLGQLEGHLALLGQHLDPATAPEGRACLDRTTTIIRRIGQVLDELDFPDQPGH